MKVIGRLKQQNHTFSSFLLFSPPFVPHQKSTTFTCRSCLVALPHLFGSGTHFSSQKEQSSHKHGNFKKLIHKFFLKVHPDLFIQYPKERQVNEKSFQTLNGYLEEYRERVFKPLSSARQQSGSTHSEERTIQFYFRPNVSDITEEAAASNVKSTESALPPLSSAKFHIVPLRGDRLSMSFKQDVEKRLVRLFQDCGMDVNLEELHAGAEKFSLFSSSNEKRTSEPGFTTTDYSKMSSFLKDYNEISRSKMISEIEDERRVAFSQTAFRINYGMNVIFEPANVSIEERTKALESLSAVVGELFAEDHAKMEECETLTLVMTPNKQHLDGAGRLNLDLNRPPETWKADISKLNMDEVYYLNRNAKRRQILEYDLSKKLGIFHIFTDYLQQNSNEYMDLLQKLEKAVDEGTFGQAKIPGKGIYGQFKELKLRITRKPRNDREEEYGILTIPFEKAFSMSSVKSAIETHGEMICGICRQKQAERNELDKLIDHTRRLFGLNRLYYDVEPEKAIHCLNRLVAFQSTFAPMLYGLRVNVTNEFGMKESGILNLKWNFEF